MFETNIFEVANSTDKSPCYLYARTRRGSLYSKAKALGCNKIALGHHFNDVIETTVMGMFYGSQLQAMLPKLHSDNGGGSKRQEIKTLLRRLKRDNPNIEKSIFNAIHTVSLDTFPGCKTGGALHSFLERYDETPG